MAEGRTNAAAQPRATEAPHLVTGLAVGASVASAADRGSDRYEFPQLTLRLDQAWRILNLNQDLIRAADQKIYLLIVMSTLLVSYVSTNLDKIIRLGQLQKSLLILFLIACAAFFYFALTTVFARSAKRGSQVGHADQADASEMPGLIFFGDIASRRQVSDYAAQFRQADSRALFDDLCVQIFQTSHIAQSKYRAYRRAWMALTIEVSLFLLLEFFIVL